MTPDDRAKKALEAYEASDLNLVEGEHRNLLSFIATAIREAEIAALPSEEEIAAVIIEAQHFSDFDTRAAQAIRSLKHPTKD